MCFEIATLGWLQNVSDNIQSNKPQKLKYTIFNNITKNKQTNKMNWIILVIAGLFEVAFASCLAKAKETTGQEMYWWYVGFLVSLTISMVLLVKATQTLPIGTAYAVWTGIGAVGTVLIGILYSKNL